MAYVGTFIILGQIVLLFVAIAILLAGVIGWRRSRNPGWILILIYGILAVLVRFPLGFLQIYYPLYGSSGELADAMVAISVIGSIVHYIGAALLVAGLWTLAVWKPRR